MYIYIYRDIDTISIGFLVWFGVWRAIDICYFSCRWLTKLTWEDFLFFRGGAHPSLATQHLLVKKAYSHDKIAIKKYGFVFSYHSHYAIPMENSCFWFPWRWPCWVSVIFRQSPTISGWFSWCFPMGFPHRNVYPTHRIYVWYIC